MNHPSIECFGISDQGLVRPNNEDVWKELLSRFFVLADGMGGHNAGEIAAKEAVENLSTAISQLFSSPFFEKCSIEEICGVLHSAIQEANYWVHLLANTSKSFNGMGTTLCCFLLHKRTLIYANVGDSRIYRYRNGLELLTQDHSLKHKLLMEGYINPTEALGFPFDHVITRAIGTSAKVEADIANTIVEDNDIYFLCSDGLTDLVSDEEIQQILKSCSSIRAASLELVSLAKSKGGSDNITIVMTKILP